MFSNIQGMIKKVLAPVLLEWTRAEIVQLCPLFINIISLYLDALSPTLFQFAYPFKIEAFITKTCLYNFDPLKPHFYIVKLWFTGVDIIFLISAENIDCGYSLEPPQWGSSNEYPQSMFSAEIRKIWEFFFIWKFSVFGGEIFYIFE